MSNWIAIALVATCGSFAIRAPAHAAPQSSRTEWGVAPDGQPGFGSGRKLRDLERLLRSSDPGDRATLAGLRALPGKVEALAREAADQARVNKYTQILEQDAPPTLEAMGAALRAAATNAEARLERGNASEVLARMLVDVRFRARARAAAGLALELRELNAALGLLSAHLDGVPNLSDRDADLVARRADLAASRLRAIQLDLTALRPDPATDRADIDASGDRERLKAALALGDRAQRSAEIAALLATLDDRESRAVMVLFTTLLEPKVEALVRARARAIERAAGSVLNVRATMPDTPEGKKAPPDLRELSKASRYGLAARAGMEAIAVDPLNDTLHYLVAQSVDFQWGIRESAQWFDRYLALRGIRPSDHRTYKDRRLTVEERAALEAMQMPAEPPR